jgi:hypothetical protein
MFVILVVYDDFISRLLSFFWQQILRQIDVIDERIETIDKGDAYLEIGMIQWCKCRNSHECYEIKAIIEMECGSSLLRKEVTDNWHVSFDIDEILLYLVLEVLSPLHIDQHMDLNM